MALTTYTVTLRTTEPDSTTPLDGVWKLTVNTVGGALINLEDGSVAAGTRERETVAGVTAFTLPAIPQTDVAPDDATYILRFTPFGERRGSLVTAPFQLDGNKVLADLYSETGVPLTPDLVSQATAARDEAVAAAAAAAQSAIDAENATGATDENTAGWIESGTLTPQALATAAADSGNPFGAALSTQVAAQVDAIAGNPQLAMFRVDDPHVALRRRTTLLYEAGWHVREGYYTVVVIGSEAAGTIRQIRYPTFRLALLWEDQEVGVRVGTWSSAQSNADAFNGTYRQAQVAGSQTITYTAPAGSTRLGFRGPQMTNSGLVKVVVDGDATKANLCPTAAEWCATVGVTDGVLTTHSSPGTLDPTDRVLDTYNGYPRMSTVTDYDALFAVYDDPNSPDAHTLMLQKTAYKHPSASDSRVMVGGFGHGTPTTRMTTTDAAWGMAAAFLSAAVSTYEYAVTYAPTGGVAAFIGNNHGNDTMVSIAYTVDGSTVALADKAVATGSQIVATRVSNLTHADAVGTVATAEVVYTFTRNLDMTVTLDWATAGTATESYVAMMAVDKKLDKARYLTFPDTLTLTAADSSFKGSKASPGAVLWDNDGSDAAAVELVTFGGVNNWLRSSPRFLAIQDRNDGVNKVYATRASTPTPEEINPGDTWEARTRFYFNHLPAATGAFIAAEAVPETTLDANTQAGASYTLVLADAGKAVEMTSASANTVTVPPEASVAFPVGTVLEVTQIGAGETTIAPGSGVTLRAPDGLVLSAQYASASLRKRAADEWVVAGSLTV